MNIKELIITQDEKGVILISIKGFNGIELIGLLNTLSYDLMKKELRKYKPVKIKTK